MRRLLIAILLALLTSLAIVPAFAQEQGTILDVAVADGHFTTLVAAIQAAGLDDELRAGGPFALGAPTDEAFEAGLAALGTTPEELFADPERLRDLLLYHLVQGDVQGSALLNLNTLVMANDVAVVLAPFDDSVMLNNAALVT